LAPWPGVDLDYFALNRADLIADVSDRDPLSLGGTVLLQKLLMLLVQPELPITYIGAVLHDERLRSKLLAHCQNQSVSQYFAWQFASVPKSTIAALERRMEALLASEGVRLALAGQTAPDFRRIQDDGGMLCINFSGPNISRSVGLTLQRLVVSDLCQAVFARRNNRPVLVAFDEAQKGFASASERENLTDLVTTSRSFGTFLCLLTQNASTAVRDERTYRLIHTNVAWCFAMRSEPSDCAFLKPALPVSGRRPKPVLSPFEDPGFYTLEQERAVTLEEMTHLPPRVGYLWLRARNAKAFKMRTAELQLPQGQDLEAATERTRTDASLGHRLTRSEYERQIAERDRKWQDAPRPLKAKLEQRWQQQRGKNQ
jgi:hypothetical protein